MRVHVDFLQLCRDGKRGTLQLFDADHLVQKTRGHRALGVEHFGVDHRAVECGFTQSIAGQFDTGVVHGHADLNFVEPDAERARHTDSIIGGQQQKSALGNGMAGAGDDDRKGVRQHAPRQGGALSNQIDGRFGT
ncbi:hypothetical protein ALP75_203574 [Pseudomonas syringae pv. actinidiae]|nr:hypothetical protein ALP75_203574 [Pseudomonas syringae pv. actinidiae]